MAKAKSTTEKEVEAVHKKLRELTSSMSEDEHALIDSLLHNAAWLQVKLDNTRTLLTDQEILIEYDNGGGQRGMRKNPGFDGYRQLLTSYTTTIKTIRDMLPEGEDDDINAFVEYTKRHARKA